MRQLTELNGGVSPNRSKFWGRAPWSKSKEPSEYRCSGCAGKIDPGSWGVWKRCMACFLKQVAPAGPWSRTNKSVWTFTGHVFLCVWFIPSAFFIKKWKFDNLRFIYQSLFSKKSGRIKVYYFWKNSPMACIRASCLPEVPRDQNGRNNPIKHVCEHKNKNASRCSIPFREYLKVCFRDRYFLILLFLP